MDGRGRGEPKTGHLRRAKNSIKKRLKTPPDSPHIFLVGGKWEDLTPLAAWVRVKSQTQNHFQSDVFNLSVIRGGLGMVVVGYDEDHRHAGLGISSLVFQANHSFIVSKRAICY